MHTEIKCHSLPSICSHSPSRADHNIGVVCGSWSYATKSAEGSDRKIRGANEIANQLSLSRVLFYVRSAETHAKHGHIRMDERQSSEREKQKVKRAELNLPLHTLAKPSSRTRHIYLSPTKSQRITQKAWTRVNPNRNSNTSLIKTLHGQTATRGVFGHGEFSQLSPLHWHKHNMSLIIEI